MALISPEALARQRRAHERTRPTRIHKLPAYGISGYKWADDVIAVAAEFGCRDALDYGAGKGTLEQAIRDRIAIRSYDPVTFPEMPGPADLVVCTDVLPFVEAASRDEVLAHIKALARKAVFIVVPQHQRWKGGPNMTPEGLSWWRATLARRWPDCRDDILKPGLTPRLRFVARA